MSCIIFSATETPVSHNFKLSNHDHHELLHPHQYHGSLSLDMPHRQENRIFTPCPHVASLAEDKVPHVRMNPDLYTLQEQTAMPTANT
jgi:hypothetical protein